MDLMSHLRQVLEQKKYSICENWELRYNIGLDEYGHNNVAPAIVEQLA
jgi:hypothetical protein